MFKQPVSSASAGTSTITMNAHRTWHTPSLRPTLQHCPRGAAAHAQDHESAERSLSDQLAEARARAEEYRDLASAQQAGVEEARTQLQASEARAGALLAELAHEKETAAGSMQEVGRVVPLLACARKARLCGRAVVGVVVLGTLKPLQCRV